MVHILCSSSDRLSRVRNIAFDLANGRVNSRDGFAKFGQEIANFERLSAAQHISRSRQSSGSDIDQKELVSEQAVRCNTCNGIGANNRKQLFYDSEFHSEF